MSCLGDPRNTANRIQLHFNCKWPRVAEFTDHPTSVLQKNEKLTDEVKDMDSLKVLVFARCVSFDF